MLVILDYIEQNTDRFGDRYGVNVIIKQIVAEYIKNNPHLFGSYKSEIIINNINEMIEENKFNHDCNQKIGFGFDYVGKKC